MQQEIRFCTTSDNVHIAYATSGQGPPFVKVANWLSHLEHDGSSPVWAHWLDSLSESFTLVRYDERGNGLSDWDVDDFSVDAWVSDLESVVDAANLDRFPLLGISQGGPVAMTYAARHPERVSHLILLGAYARGRLSRDPTPDQIDEWDAQVKLIEVGWGRENPAFRQMFTSFFIPGATQEQMNWFNDLQRVSTSPENAVRFRQAFMGINVVDVAQRIETPTLVCHARRDATVPFEEGRLLASLIPGARFVPLDSQNHILLGDEPAWPHFLQEMFDFIGVQAREQSINAVALDDLTAREVDVLNLIAQGLTNDEIADSLVLSPKTVRNHITSIFSKLGVSHRAQAVVLAREAGLGRTV